MNAHHKKRTYLPLAPKDVYTTLAGVIVPPAAADAAQPADTMEVEAARVAGGESAMKKNVKEKEFSMNKLERMISRRPFGSQLTAIIPTLSGTTSTLPEELKELVLKSTQFRYCSSMNLADLLEPAFMNAYIRQGNLIGLSLGRGEGDDVVSIDGRGRLFLSVSKDTYELLGLVGRPSAYSSPGQRFIIEIDLKAPSFRAGKKGFEQIKSKLARWPKRTSMFEELGGTTGGAKEAGRGFEMVFSFVNSQGHPVDVTFPSTITSSLRQTSLSSSTLKSTAIPSLATFINGSPSYPPSTKKHAKMIRPKPSPLGNAMSDAVEDWEERSERLKEWLGLVGIGVDSNFDEDEEELDEWEWETEKGDVTSLTWEGFFHPTTVLKISQLLSSHLSSSTPTHPFLSISLLPSPSSPLSHLSTKNPPLPSTRKRKNGKRVKRGRGRGEEEELRRGMIEGQSEEVWRVVFARGKEGEGVRWVGWEGKTG